jgi:hypothetical protein
VSGKTRSYFVEYISVCYESVSFGGCAPPCRSPEPIRNPRVEQPEVGGSLHRTPLSPELRYPQEKVGPPRWPLQLVCSGGIGSVEIQDTWETMSNKKSKWWKE